jgi:hypothetical protein
MHKMKLVFAILLLINGIAAKLCEASGPSPVARTEFWSNQFKFDAQIFADKDGKPAVNIVLATIVGKNNVVDARSHKTVCKEEKCEAFLDLIVSPYDAEVDIYIFKQARISGRLFAQIRYGNIWGWVRVRDEDRITLLEKGQILCYQEQQEQRRTVESKVIQGGEVTPGSSVKLSAKAKNGYATWEILVKSPSILSIESSDGVDATISPLSSSTKEPEIRATRRLESGKPMPVAAPAGRYRITLEEPLEGDAEPSCPSIVLTAVVRASATFPKELVGKIETQARQAQPIPFDISSEPRTYRATLSWLHPRVTFASPSRTPSLVNISIPQPLPPGVSFTVDRDSRPLKGKGPWLLLADHDGETGVSLALEDPISTDKVVDISFSAAYLLLTNPSKELFSLANTPLQKIDFGDPLSLDFQVRNNGAFDLSNVEVFVKPYPDNSTPSEFHPKRPWDTELIRHGKEEGEHYTGWVEKIPKWKKGEVRTFNYGNVAARTTLGGTYGVMFELISLEKRSINQSFANAYFELAKVNPIEAFTPEYEKGLRVKVWGSCGKRDPSYKAGFQACQEILLNAERACRKTVRAGSPNFERCVSDSLHKRNPSLIK